jgi:transposase
MCMNKEIAQRIYDSGKESTIAKLIELDSKVDELTAHIAKLSKNSSNSSKPPSSDIVKPNREQRRKDKKKRSKGGQHNHPKWERQPFGQDEVTPVEYAMKTCPDCGTTILLLPDEPPKTLQQVEIVTPPIEKIEHRAYAYWCPNCACTHYAPIPKEVTKAGLFKAQISSTVCFLKFVGCMSLSGIKKYLHDSMGISVTKGFLAKVIQKGSTAVEPCYNELLGHLPSLTAVHVDETGFYKNDGAKLWAWVFRTSLFALFKIAPSRGSNVLIEVLGKEFNGVLGCDYFSAYHKYMKDFNVVMQFCLAHLIRDVKYLVEFPDASIKHYGTKILDALRDLFHIIHVRDTMSTEKFKAQLEAQKHEVINAATGDVPSRREAENMAKRFRKNGEAYFTFITTPEIDPTNNCAEQAIRFIIYYRMISQGVRSEKGCIACERFFTIVATCALQGRSAFNFIKQAFESYFKGTHAPSLIPATINSA